MIKYKEIISNLKNIFINANFNIYFFILVIFYTLYQLFIFMNISSMVPDELNYWGMSHSFNLLNRSPPPIDYGSIYWFLLKILHYKILIRFIFFIFYITPVIAIILLIKDNISRFIFFLLYLSFPYAYWTGKLIGPEILIVFICTLSLVFLKYRMLKMSNFILGIGAGIKISIVPFILIFYLLLLLKTKINLRTALICILFFLIGLWFSNPVNIDLYLLHLTSSSYVAGDPSNGILNKLTFERLKIHLFTLGWAWDNVMLYSFSQMFLSPILLLTLTLLLYQKNNIINIIIFYIFFTTSLILISITNSMFIWYWFPFIPALVICFCDYKIDLKNSIMARLAFIMLIIIIGLNFYKNIIFSSRQISDKISSIEFYRNLKETEACLIKSLPKINSNVIINKLDFGYSTDKIFPTYTQKLHHGAEIGNEPTILLFSRNNIQNPYNFESLGRNFKLNYYGSCSDQVFIFTSN